MLMLKDITHRPEPSDSGFDTWGELAKEAMWAGSRTTKVGKHAVTVKEQIRPGAMEGAIDLFRATYGTMFTPTRAPVSSSLLTNAGTGRVLTLSVWKHAGDLPVMEARLCSGIDRPIPTGPLGPGTHRMRQGEHPATLGGTARLAG